MPKIQLKTLTEQMYYVLLALRKERYGVEITEYILDLTNGRIKLGPGTLYAMLSKFLEEKMIREVNSEGRKRSYIITSKGQQMLDEEYRKLLLMIEDTHKSEVE